MPDTPAPGPASSNAPADTSNNAALGDKLYPNGADNENGGGTGQSTSVPVEPSAASADPTSATSGEPKPAAAVPPVEPAPASGEGEKPKAEGDVPQPLTVESYGKLALPEGFQVNDALLGDFKTLAVETGVQPDAAQKLIDLYGRAMKAQTDQLSEAWNATQSKWTTDLNAMPEFQGERRAQTEAVLGKVIEEFTSSPAAAGELKAALNATGMGNNPHLVRLIYDMASALVEDEPLAPGQPTASEGRRGKSLGQILYPPQPN